MRQFKAPRLELHEVPCDDFDVGEFRIGCQMVCHPGPTVGFRITAPEGVRTSLTRPSEACRTMPPLGVRVTIGAGGRPAVLLEPNTRPPGGGFMPGRLFPPGLRLTLTSPPGRLLFVPGVFPGVLPGRLLPVLPNPPRLGLTLLGVA